MDRRSPSGEVGRGRLGLRDGAVDTDQLGSSWDLKGPYGAWHMAYSMKQGRGCSEHTGCLINSCSVSRRIDGSQFIK